ncbi:MAG TPA: ADOP family duplicated permease, partial [Longimicrobiales bacterium]|nr:ADOP family duplicated permease [Longimicrobiales bacterium]
LRHAIRTMRRMPAFSFGIIATLALGIGATTAIFSTVNAVLLRPLPYPGADALYALGTERAGGRPTSGGLASSEIVRLEAGLQTIDRAVGLRVVESTTLLRDDGTPRSVNAYSVSEGFFELFGLPLALGSGFAREDHLETAAHVAVISFALWQNEYGADPAILGQQIRLVGSSNTIMGVASPELDLPRGADVWLSASLNPQGLAHDWNGFVRLKPDASLARAESEMAGVMAGLARDFPASAGDRSYVVTPLVESIVGDLGAILILVLLAVAALLLLACMNLASLLLARATVRMPEFALRRALGARPTRILRQLLTETLLMALAGGLLGLGAAYLGVRLLQNLGASELPRLATVPFDAAVLLFAILALLSSVVLVGLAPALRLARTDLTVALKDEGRSATGSRATARWLRVLTMAEVALSVALVAGAGWLVRSYAGLRAIDPGFETEHRLIADVSVAGDRYADHEAESNGIRDLLAQVRTVPGVRAAGATFRMPLRSAQPGGVPVLFPGEDYRPGEHRSTLTAVVSPGYFEAMGIELVSGREFSDEDDLDAPERVVVSRTFVERFLSGRQAVGERFIWGYPEPVNKVTIIGVAEDIRHQSLFADPLPLMYLSLLRRTQTGLSLVVESTADDPGPLEAGIRGAVRRFDPGMPVEFEPVTDLVRSLTLRQRVGMVLMLLFGAAAVLLAALGVYGIIANAAVRRRREMATRLALGAAPASLFWLILKEGASLALAGTGIGLGIALVAGRIVSSRLYEVRTLDPAILAGAAAVILAIALLATLVPALRTMRLEPSGVLRS